MADSFVGQFTLSGFNPASSSLAFCTQSPDWKNLERIGRLFEDARQQARRHQRNFAGHICAAVAENVGTVTHLRRRPRIGWSRSRCGPVINRVEPKTKADQEKMAWRWLNWRQRSYLQSSYDPTAPDHHRRHGRVAPRNHRDRMMREYKVEANSASRVGTAKTIRKKAEGEGKYIRQTVAADNTDTPKIRSSRRSRAGYVSSNDIMAVRFRKNHQAIDQGIPSARRRRAAGYESRCEGYAL